MTNDARLYILKKTLDSLIRYNGPKATFGEMREGVDDDIWEEIKNLERMVEERINAVEKMDWDKEAV